MPPTNKVLTSAEHCHGAVDEPRNHVTKNAGVNVPGAQSAIREQTGREKQCMQW